MDFAEGLREAMDGPMVIGVLLMGIPVMLSWKVAAHIIEGIDRMFGIGYD